jgi:LPXTG-site transpeptidase (sortase) family protein
MSRSRWARVTVVMAATMAGGALVAFLVVPRVGATDDPVAAGLVAPATRPAAVAPSASTPTGSSTTPDLPSLTAAPATLGGQDAAAAPTRVAVARLGIDMTVEPQGVLPDGQMALPASPTVAGWYKFGSAPDDAGATVIAAHVDSRTGVGPFVRLSQAKVGDEVDVWVGEQRQAYRVTTVVRVDKARLNGDGLFAVSGPRVLHLVTCTGAYVPGSGYTDNLVVIADPVVT